MKNLTPLTWLALRDPVRVAAMIIAGLTTLQSVHAALLPHWDFNTIYALVDGANLTLVANPAGEVVLRVVPILKDNGDCCPVLPLNHLNLMPKIHIIKAACLPACGTLVASRSQASS